VLIHAPESVVKKHPCYPAAKSGDAEAARDLVRDAINEKQVEALRSFLAGKTPTLVSVHAYESEGVNAIPEAFADILGNRLGLATDTGIVQTNVVAHTGADGYGRLARQPVFDGDVVPGAEYVLVDDFVGQGGTLANLRGFIECHGGTVLAAVTLTGKPYSAKLALDKKQLEELRQKHGKEFEKWWQERFGYSFDCLTQSEARYLARSPDAETIRNRIAAAQQAGDCRQAEEDGVNGPICES
jgi:adenine/guanine phosphoribosyltransferase-like PRPP-binding protein